MKRILQNSVFVLMALISMQLPMYAQSNLEAVLSKIHYRNVGPSKQGGRVMDIAAPDQKKQPYTYYVAFSTGGLLKTRDNFLTFEPVTDGIDLISIGDVAVSYSNPDVVWIGTGNNAYYGNGVFKSTDGGKTWENMGLRDSHYTTRIRIHPQDPDIVYVAMTGYDYSDDTGRGIFKTTNGGKTWEKSLGAINGDDHIGVADLVMHPGDPNILYASIWDRQGGEESLIYKTTDGGKNWKKKSKGLPIGLMGKIGLDISMSNPETLYAVAIGIRRNKDSNGENAVFRTDNGAELWRRVSPKEVEIRGGARFGQLRVDPNDLDHVYVMNTGIQISDDGGRTWYKGIRFGGDNQAMWIDPENSDHIVLGYDYGVAVSYTGGETWYHPDNIPNGLFFDVSYDMDFPYNVYGGTQDFGSWKGPSTKRGRFPIRMEDWQHLKGADGAYVQVDPSDSRWLYVESQNGDISRNDQKTSVRKNIQYRKEGLRFNFVSPILISPHNPNIIFHAANMVLRSSYRGEDWEEISPDLTNYHEIIKPRTEGTTQDEYMDGYTVKRTISTLDESPIEQGVIWVGTDDGNVQLTRDNGGTWTKLNDNIPGFTGYVVTRILASNHKKGTAYLTVSGLRNRFDLRPYVYKTADYGQTWQPISNNLPDDEPVDVIVEDYKNPELLFVGTTKSVYVSIDGGDNWNPLRNNMPRVPIHDLEIHPRESDLIVGTFGRSIWIADISPLQELVPEVMKKEEHLFDIEPQVLWMLSEQTQVGAAMQNFNGENAPHGIVINYYLKDKAEGDVIVQIFRGDWLINEYYGGTAKGLNTVQWYLTERIPRTEEEKKEFDRWFESDEEEFFDYYDGHDHFGEADMEVSVYGRSLEIWIHILKEWRERRYKYIRARPGTYTVQLSVNGKKLRKNAMVLKDHWYDRNY
ncbi:hypothetical protein [Ulvibacterium sp.]|uniref:WD40/YVTN/BNR-like repeat-containing protein n=1 Tax=Ulvibacterium sp. TaxID=2665914 RepID=UPI0026227CA7|nr:hypothetical protein [Ulvibacterium sp.]